VLALAKLEQAEETVADPAEEANQQVDTVAEACHPVEETRHQAEDTVAGIVAEACHLVAEASQQVDTVAEACHPVEETRQVAMTCQRVAAMTCHLVPAV